ncbi:hypothetical protein N7494_002553 [Penicillium frequentans]|uniref:Nucleoside phosphorylase domain-containing protein n=1 Tax=Penicillium frequentans TaxID=3151616 RepID=A0AAD6D691_9EURO|nr:hypothetical protein N7494_002553 [Penicillium glabrum]
MSDRGKYTVGWICALGVEYVAAQEFLDEEHERPTSLPGKDTNDYTLGRISGHNIVIAVLPEGEYGTDSAASVATNMLSSFANVKIGLLVGIGGGVPSQRHDIRLGDVVVSAPRDGYGGVFQYDFGKSIQGQVFQTTRFLNQPPTILRTAMTGLMAQYERKGHQLDEKISGILSKNARLRIAYKRPQPESDMLFKAKILHGSAKCAITCASDPSRLILRHERTKYEDNPAIHYGLIASANQSMKDASMRDLLASEKDVICFEMEAAGLMNTFPCLVIRGICDYSDSHKNKEWQGYASMVAAAYAKDLLYRITPTDVETVPKIEESLSQECLHLFRLTSNTKDTTYGQYKDHVEARVHGTCEWFLNHYTFQKWLESDFGLLLVSADPGCGKSVLAKYLIDEGLPRSVTICYFFFKSHDQNTTRQALCALLDQLFSQKPFLIKHAMEEYKNVGQGLINSTKSLWNIMRKAVQDPGAGSITIVLDALDECIGSDFEELIRNIEVLLHDSLWGRSKLKCLLTTRPYEQIVRKFTKSRKPYPYVRIPGEEESDSISREISHVIRYRVEQLAQEIGLSDRVKSRLETRLLEIPHRTYLWIYLVFEFLTTEPFKKTPKGINSAIDSLPKDVYRAYERILSKSKKNPLVRKALCVILAASRPLKLSEMNIALNVNTTFKSTHELDLEDDKDFGLRLRSLCGLFVSVYHGKIYLFHETAREFLLASSSRTHTFLSGPTWQQSITEKSAHAVLAEVCVAYLDFLNTEVVRREFQEERGQTFDEHQFLEYSAKNWGTHCLMACININDTMVPSILRTCSPDSRSWGKWFIIYWNTKHDEPTACFTSLMISCYFGLEAIVKLLLKRGADIGFKDNKGRTSLSWAARNGHANIVKLLLEEQTNIPRAISIIPMIAGWRASRMISFILGHSSTLSLPLYALHLTAKIGYEQTFQQLLRSSQDLEEKDIQGRSPLLCAVENSGIEVADILVRAGAQVNVVNNMQQNPLHVICQKPRRKDRLALLKYFVSRGTPTSLCDVNNMTPFLYAVGNQSKDLILHLLDTGFDVNSRLHRQCWTAQVESRLVTYRINENSGRPVERELFTGLTALHFSALNGMAGTTALLLEHGANPNAADENGDTPLHLAIRCRVLGHEYNDPWITGEYAVETLNDIITDYEEEAFRIWDAIDQARYSTVQQILNSQAIDVNIANNEGEYPLHVIPFLRGQPYLACAELSALLDHGAKVSSLNFNRQTCLHLASKAGNLEAVRILIDKGCDISLLDGNGLSPVHYAVGHNHSDIIQLIFESRQEQFSQICVQCDHLGKEHVTSPY